MSKKNIIKIYSFHFVAAIVSVFVFLLAVSFYLNTYTKHDQYIECPDVLNKPLKDAVQIITNNNLRYTIIDSIYLPDKEAGIVISQNPDPHFKVKENRNIYITITSFLPPSVEMPKLVDLSERQAIMIINSYGLKPGKIIYEPSYCNGCVIKQLYHHKEILPGQHIKKGSVIDLIIGQKGTQTPSSSANNDTINNENSSLDHFN